MLEIIQFQGDNGTDPGVQRTRRFFQNWITSNVTPLLLTQMIQAMAGQPGITPGLKLYVHPDGA